jgi:hypothetical protein
MQVPQEFIDSVLDRGILENGLVYNILIERKKEIMKDNMQVGAGLVLSLLRQGYTPEQLQEMWETGTLPGISQ